jgi:hypothetical protein
MTFEFNRTEIEPYLGYQIDEIYDTVQPGSDNPDDPYHAPLGDYWNTDHFTDAANNDIPDVPSVHNNGPPDPPDTTPPTIGETPDDPDKFGVGRFDQYKPSPHEAIEAGLIHTRYGAMLLNNGRFRNYVNHDEPNHQILQLEANTPQGPVFITVSNAHSVSAQFGNATDSAATHWYIKRDGVVHYHIEDIWSVFDEAEAPIEVTDKNGLPTSLMPPEMPDPNQSPAKPSGRIVGIEELTSIFKLAAEANPITVPFAHLRDTARINIANPLPPESDEPVWAGQEFAGYVRAGVELYAGGTDPAFIKSITNEQTGDSVTVEAGESPDASDPTIRNPYAHIRWTHRVNQEFLNTVPKPESKEDQAILASTSSGKEIISLSYKLTNGELVAMFRHIIVTNTRREHLIVGSGRLHFRCSRRIARDLRNYFRKPVP